MRSQFSTVSSTKGREPGGFIYTTDMPLDDKEKRDIAVAFGAGCFDKCVNCHHWRFLHRYDGRQPGSECIECAPCKEFMVTVPGHKVSK